MQLLIHAKEIVKQSRKKTLWLYDDNCEPLLVLAHCPCADTLKVSAAVKAAWWPIQLSLHVTHGKLRHSFECPRAFSVGHTRWHRKDNARYMHLAEISLVKCFELCS